MMNSEAERKCSSVTFDVVIILSLKGSVEGGAGKAAAVENG